MYMCIYIYIMHHYACLSVYIYMYMFQAVCSTVNTKRQNHSLDVQMMKPDVISLAVAVKWCLHHRPKSTVCWMTIQKWMVAECWYLSNFSYSRLKSYVISSRSAIKWIQIDSVQTTWWGSYYCIEVFYPSLAFISLTLEAFKLKKHESYVKFCPWPILELCQVGSSQVVLDTLLGGSFHLVSGL